MQATVDVSTGYPFQFLINIYTPKKLRVFIGHLDDEYAYYYNWYNFFANSCTSDVELIFNNDINKISFMNVVVNEISLYILLN